MNNGIMDRFFSEVNQKVNLGRRPPPSPNPISLIYRTDFWKTRPKIISELKMSEYKVC